MGGRDDILGADMDSSGRFWYLSETIGNYNTVKITQWAYQGAYQDTSRHGQLIESVSEEFLPEKAGVHQLFNFDEQTGSFNPNNTFSMMVAAGYKKVMLIQTGVNSAGALTPTAGDPATYTKVYEDAVIQGLGPICCAAISQSAAADEGWLFVAGYNGIAILCDDNGDGFSPANLNDVTTDLSTLSFRKLGTFSKVYKLVCDEEFLYIMTKKKLYRMAMNNVTFSDPGTAVAINISEPGDADLPTTDENSSFLDFIVANRLGLLATTHGLYRTANGSSVKDVAEFTEVKSKSGYNLGAVTHLYPISETRGSFSTGGNLYVTAANMSTDLTSIFRYDITSTGAIDATTVTPITEGKLNNADTTRDQYYAIGKMRSAFATDGTFGFHILPYHFKRADFLRKISMGYIQSTIRNGDVNFGLNFSTTNYNIAIPVQNSTSGSWIMPGDWGLRINE